MPNTKKTSRTKRAETPAALAARMADEHLAVLVTDHDPGCTEISSGIEEVYHALGGDIEAKERDAHLYGRASYLVGVQVGLRLRNVEKLAGDARQEVGE